MARKLVRYRRHIGFAATCIVVASAGPIAAQNEAVDPGKLRPIGRVDSHYQSYNIEMVEVTGGRFWAPYKQARDGDVDKGGADKRGDSGGVNSTPAIFRQREPIDLGDRRLRAMAKALAPSYVRVSGAWANSTYFHDSDAPPPAKPPAGYQGILTRAQWAGVVAFSRAAGADLVVSFAGSMGSRAADLTWKPDQARKLMRLTHRLGGRIAAAEFVNEPNVGSLVGLPAGYTANIFASDVAALRTLAAVEAPGMKIVGPGSTGEAGFVLFPKRPAGLDTETLMRASPKPVFDIFSYHSYGTVSRRCAAMDPSAGIAPDHALDEAWLARADTVFDHYKAIHDRYAPRTPIWVTEIAQAACGGDAWAATYRDAFRYVDQLGRLAQRGLSVNFHNTFAASDYALIDEETMTPRPSYWAALLWRRTMGEVVLDSGSSGARAKLRVYAQCSKEGRGGVTLVAINLDEKSAVTLPAARGGMRYTLTSDGLDGHAVSLNGSRLQMAGDALPTLRGQSFRAGDVTLPPASISYLALPKAGNPACR